MKKDKFLEEMLNEVKNLKDLAKEELPEVAKEYIKTIKIINGLGLIMGLGVLLISVLCGFYLYLNSGKIATDLEFLAVFIGGGSLIIGCIISCSSGVNLINAYFQPRRMAIKAITSLKNE